MNGWLDDVLGAYLDRVTEREFDPVFLTYLRSAGFTEIHQLHGPYEFGKDFIARRNDIQWTFQTKAGDLNQSTWRTVRSQVEEMLWNDIAHPGFDASLPRQAVLVTTGRLVGGAGADAQQYQRTLQARSDGSNPPFQVWEREHLIQKLSESPDLSLNGWGTQPLYELLRLLADTEREGVSVQRIQRATQQWVDGELDRACLLASIIGSHFAERDRLDLACATAYALVRAAAAVFHQTGSETAAGALKVGRALFRTYATPVAEWASRTSQDPEALTLTQGEPFAVVTYPVRCLVTIETLAMLGLLEISDGNAQEAERLASILAEFVAHQPGASHPISDRWAVSLIPAAVLLRRYFPEAAVGWLEQVAVWICDRHEQGAGLANPYSTPAEEIRHILGDPYVHVGLQERHMSYLATTVLDLASALQFPALFRDSLNDFLAVDIAFPTIEPLDEVGQYTFSGTGVVSESNISFSENHDFDESWMSGVHHRRAVGRYTLQESGHSWELLCVSLLLRDRHFLSVTRELAGLDEPALTSV